MKLLILGASRAQLPGIQKAHDLGCEVVTCDYYEDVIGHEYSDSSHIISTFDKEGVRSVAELEKVDGIMTLGTDQPVLTAAYVATRLGLPKLLDEATALSVTNKKVMKKLFDVHNIPTVPYLIYQKGLNDSELEELFYPVVVKPIDSQGQRGIFYLESARQVIDHYEQVIEHSRELDVLVEQYYPNDEITVSGWVDEGQVTILSITDRVTFQNQSQLGICLSHEYPSRFLAKYKEELEILTRQITKVFKISNGPIYYQFLLGAQGVLVNEIACRIGGAHEATFLPRVRGFDITKAAVQLALGLEHHETMKVMDKKSCVSVQLFFCEPCTVKRIPDPKQILTLDGVFDYHMNLSVGDQVGDIENATKRAGYLLVEAADKNELEQRLKDIYKFLVIIDENGQNCLVHRPIR